jgi:hypothetical protein
MDNDEFKRAVPWLILFAMVAVGAALAWRGSQ